MLRKILSSKRGEGGYIDVIIGVLAVCMCLVVALATFTTIFNKNTMDRIADDLIETAAYSGAFGEEFDAKVAELKQRYGDNFTVEIHVGENGWYNSEKKQVQLGDEMYVTVRRTSVMGRFGIEALTANLSTTRESLSEKYWKTENAEYEEDPDTPVETEYKFVIDLSQDIFHHPDCELVGYIASSYRENSNRSYEQLVNAGYAPCTVCNPHNCVASDVAAFNATSHWGVCETCGGASSVTRHNFFSESGGIYKCVDCHFTQEYSDTYCRECHAPVAGDDVHYMDCRGYAVVTFYANGGMFYPSGEWTNTVTYNTSTGAIVHGTYSTPVNDGQVFNGWYLDNAGITPFDPAQAEGKVDVYANWGTVILLTINEDNRDWEEIGFTDDATTLSIPETFKRKGQNYRVVEIASDAFAETKLQTVYIPDSVTKIGSYAFWSCEDLVSVRLPGGLTTLEECVFENCSALTTVELPGTLTYIGTGAFYGTGLQSITLPAGLKTISNDAFRGATKLTSITIPASVQLIDESAFSNCTSLTTIRFEHEKGAYIDIVKGAFYVPTLTETTLIARNETVIGYDWASDRRALKYEDLTITAENRHLIGFTDNTANLTFPEIVSGEDGTMYRVVGIGAAAFNDCNALTSVTFPHYIKSIASNAFASCEQLTTITFEHNANSTLELGTNVFYVDNTVQTTLNTINDVALEYDWLGDNRRLQYEDFIVLQGNRHMVGYQEVEGGMDLDIPAVFSYEGKLYRVIGIGTDAFSAAKLGNVTIPGTVTSIGGGAFAESTITTIRVEGNNLETIGTSAFENCRNLGYVGIPDSVTEIGASAFQGCESLMTVDLPDNLTVIADCLFQECYYLADMEIPEGVTIIGSDAFYQCYGLTNIVIPSSVTNIGGTAFANCNSLTDITFEHTNDDAIALSENAFYLTPENALETTLITANEHVREYDWAGDNRELAAVEITITTDNRNLIGYTNTTTNLVIPSRFVGADGVEYKVIGVGDSAFEGCANVTQVTLPTSGLTYGSYCFAGTGIQTITLPTDLKEIPAGMFEGCANLTTISVPKSVTKIGDNAFAGCSKLSKVTLQEGLVTIGESAFAKTTSLTDITLPNTLRSIGESAFADSKIRSIVIPEGITAIEDDTFKGCGVQTVTLPSTLKTIGANAFYQNDITTLTIPNGVTSIGENAFAYANITKLTVPASVTRLGNMAFGYCDSLNDITFAHTNNNAITLDKSVFVAANKIETTLVSQNDSVWDYNWAGDKRTLKVEELTIDVISRYWPEIGFNDNTTQLTIPANIVHEGTRYKVVGIGDGAFRDARLTEVVLPEGITTIGAEAFRETSLEKISLPSTLVSIGASAFEGSALKSAVIPEGVTRIEDSTFYDCGLESIVLPSTLEYIGFAAFNCDNLTEVVIPDNVTAIDSSAFSECTKLAKVTLPTKLVTIGRRAFEYTAITSITIPASVTSIGDSAFEGCEKLTDIVFEHGVANTIQLGENVFMANNYSAEAPLRTNLTAKKDDVWAYDWTGDNRLLQAQDFIVIEENRHLVGYTGTANEKLVIPETFVHEGTLYTVVGIGDYAFSETQISSITMPDTVVEIGSYAFADSMLSHIEFSDNLEFIGDGAFYCCVHLTGELKLPDLVRDVGSYAFEECGSITSATIPSGMSSIPEGMFCGCSDLVSVTLHNNIAAIDERAFYGCHDLATINIPGSVESIGEEAFADCTPLDNLMIPSSVTQISDRAFAENPNLSTITFEHTADDELSLGAQVFYVDALTSTNVLSTLSSVYDYDWEGDNRLLTAKEFIITKGNRGDVGYTNSIKTLNIPQTFVKDGTRYVVTGIDVDAFAGCTNLVNVTIPESVTNIMGYSFSGCSNLQSVRLPSGITRIEDCVFNECASLQSINIPDGVYLINNEAFYGCAALKEIAIPASVESIYDYAFYGCTSLTSISIPESVTYIADLAFSDCTNLTSITFQHGPTAELELGDSVFFVPTLTGTELTANNGNVDDYDWLADNRATESVNLTIDEDSRYWPEIGFTDDTSSLVIPETLTHEGVHYRVVGIGDYAFYETNLKTVTLPESVTSIGENAFAYTLLNSIDLPDALTTIGASAFECANLDSIVIPEGITRIEAYTFFDCGLSSIVFPSTLDYIGESAFTSANGVTELIIPNGVTTIEAYAFDELDSLTSITIPASVETIGDFAFSYCDELATIKFEHTSSDTLVLGNKAFLAETTYNSTNPMPTKLITTQMDIVEYDWRANNRTLQYTDLIVEKDNRHLVGYTDTATSIELGTHVDEKGTVYQVIGIGEGAFAGCTNLRTIDTPDSLTFINKEAFKGCTSLREVSGTRYLNYIGDGAFDGCIALNDSFLLTRPITEIGDYAFRNTNFSEITLSGTITNIGTGAFYGCSNLTDITFKHGKDADIQIGQNAFYVSQHTETTLNNANAMVEAYDWAGDNRALDYEELVIDTANRYWEEIGFDDDATELTIPAVFVHEGTRYRVIGIGNSAFYETALESVTLPEGIASIGASAFAGSMLNTINLPSTLTSIGASAFEGSALKSAVIPEGVTRIEDSTFNDCGLESIVLPSTLEYIGFAAFNCDNLTEVVIPDNVTIIDRAAFSECTQLAKVTLPAKLTTIGSDAFEHTAITSIAIPSSVTVIGEGAFEGCDSLTSITIPASVTTIGTRAFSYCDKLATITFNHGANAQIAIGTNAFLAETHYNQTNPQQTTVSAVNDSVWEYDWTGDNRSLGYTNFTITEDNRGEIGYTVGTTVLDIPETFVGSNGVRYRVVEIGNQAFVGNNLQSVTIPDSVTRIGNGAFAEGTLREITIPDSVVSIGTSAFEASALRKVVLPAGITSIEAWTFFDTGLEEVIIPESVEYIGPYAFSTTYLAEITIPSSVKEIADGAFDYNDNLTTITFEHAKGSPVIIGDDAFYVDGLTATNLTALCEDVWEYDWEGSNRALVCGEFTVTEDNRGEVGFTDTATTLDIPATFVDSNGKLQKVVGIGEYAFCEVRVQQITLPNTVTQIGEYAFLDSYLRSITLPDGLKTIEAGTFANSDVESIVIPEGVTQIGDSAFQDVDDLKSVTLPSTLQYIGPFAFGYTAITEITIPSSATYIDKGAFEYCSSLVDITFEHGYDDEITFGSNAFYADEELTTNLITESVDAWSYNWTGDNRVVDIVELTLTKDNWDAIEYTETTTTLEIKPVFVYNGQRYKVTAIGSQAFEAWDETSSLETVIIPQSVISIGNAAFEYSPVKTVVVKGNNLRTIGAGTFEYSNLESITLPDSVTTIGSSAFQGAKLTSFEIPAGVTILDYSVFQECSELTAITIPATVTTIRSDAFAYCDKLTNITFEHSKNIRLTIEDDAFDCLNGTIITTVYLPNGFVLNYDWEADNRDVTIVD